MDKVSIDFLRNQVLRNAYGNDDTPIAKLDPRVLIVWYLFFGLVPWFLSDVTVLLGLFLFCAVTTRLARVAPLVLFVFARACSRRRAICSSWRFSLAAASRRSFPCSCSPSRSPPARLRSITVFSGLDPDRLSNGLLWFGCPERLSFSISFAYRILPIMFEELQNILLSFRLRGQVPAHDTLMGKLRWLVYQVKTIVQSFYPLTLNMAKRSRTTVEALAAQGVPVRIVQYGRALHQARSFAIARIDLIFAAVSIASVRFASRCPLSRT